MIQRCDWANSSMLETTYHDTEWGKEVHDDSKLFEMLILESMQAGLSWSTILAKRETLRNAYDNFDADIIVNYTQDKLESLMQDTGVIRNRLKINSVVTNAHAFKNVQKAYGSFDQYIWSFVDGKPKVNRWGKIGDVPASTALSDEISKDLKKKGFKFLGTTSVYAFMQSVGIVDDHLETCFLKHGV